MITWHVSIMLMVNGERPRRYHCPEIWLSGKNSTFLLVRHIVYGVLKTSRQARGDMTALEMTEGTLERLATIYINDSIWVLFLCSFWQMFLKSVVVCDGLAPFVGKRYGLLMLQIIQHQYRQASALYLLRIGVNDFLFQMETLVSEAAPHYEICSS